MTNQTVKKSELASYLNWQIELSGKKQYDIAQDCGFDKPNIITMIKQGKTRLPRDKVVKMAKSLCVDPINLMKMTYLEYYPEEWAMIEGLIGQPVLTDGEMQIIQTLRASNADEDTVRNAKVRLEDYLKTVK